MGPTGRRLTRALYRVLAPRLVTSMPEVAALFGRRGLAAEAARPFDVEAMAREVPGGAYAVAGM